MKFLEKDSEELNAAIATGGNVIALYFDPTRPEETETVLSVCNSISGDFNSDDGISFFKIDYTQENPSILGGISIPAIYFYKKKELLFRIEVVNKTAEEFAEAVKSFVSADFSVKFGRRACYVVGDQDELEIKLKNLSDTSIQLKNLSIDFKLQNKRFPCAEDLDARTKLILPGRTREYGLSVQTPFEHSGNVSGRVRLSYVADNKVKFFESRKVKFYVWTPGEFNAELEKLQKNDPAGSFFCNFSSLDEFIETQILGLAERGTLEERHFRTDIYHELMYCALDGIDMPEYTFVLEGREGDKVLSRSELSGVAAVIKIGMCKHSCFERCSNHSTWKKFPCGADNMDACGNHIVLYDKQRNTEGKKNIGAHTIPRRAADLHISESKVELVTLGNIYYKSRLLKPGERVTLSNGDDLHFHAAHCPSADWKCHIKKDGDKITEVKLEWINGVAGLSEDGRENAIMEYVIRQK